MIRVVTACFVLAIMTGTASAQHGGHAGQGASQPYAGHHQRTVKALSEQQVADLKAGRGMGLALAAELNGYPGPVHVLEHGEALKLSPKQRAGMQRLVETMKAEAISLGERLIAQETALDRLFAERRATPESLAASTSEIGATQAALRTAHLRTHLEAIKLLSEEQLEKYAQLRGYGTR